MSDSRWAPAERRVPHLLGDLMHMGAVTYSGHRIEQYKHRDTRRYLNLDTDGRAWQIAVHPDTGETAARRVELADALERVLG